MEMLSDFLNWTRTIDGWDGSGWHESGMEMGGKDERFQGVSVARIRTFVIYFAFLLKNKILFVIFNFFI